MNSKKAVIGLVSTQAAAEQIVGHLQRAGFFNSDISALLPDKRAVAISRTSNIQRHPRVRSRESVREGPSAVRWDSWLESAHSRFRG